MVPYFAAPLSSRASGIRIRNGCRRSTALSEVGTEDLIYKLAQGYKSYSKGEKLGTMNTALWSKATGWQRIFGGRVMMFANGPTIIVERKCNADPDSASYAAGSRAAERRNVCAGGRA